MKTSNTLHRYRLFLLLIGLAAIAPSFTPDANGQTPKAESRFATVDGARVHYVNYGKGDEAVVLIHGWTQSIDGWRDQIPEFANQYRVIALDLPGHGKSDKPQHTNEPVPKGKSSKPFVYSMDLFARAVDAVMTDAKVKRAVLVGHSMGTPVARQFYRKYPARTLGIVIVDGSLRPFFDKPTMDGLLAGLRGPKHRELIDQMFAGMMGPGLTNEAKERIASPTANTPQYVFVSAMEAMADPAIWAEDKINVPVLAVLAKGPFFPPNVEELFRAIAPKMEFHMWDGVGHFLMMEKPKEFNEAVLAWLKKNELLKKS